MKRPGFFQQYVLHNLWLKIVSLALAFIFWMLVTGGKS